MAEKEMYWKNGVRTPFSCGRGGGDRDGLQRVDGGTEPRDEATRCTARQRDAAARREANSKSSNG